MKWIKVSDGHFSSERHAKYKDGNHSLMGVIYPTEDGYEFATAGVTLTLSKKNLENVSYLDESPVEAAEGEEWGKLAGEFCDILFDANGTGSGSDVIIEHLKNNYHLIKKQS